MDEKKFIEFYHRQKESGLTVKEFCSNEIIAPSTFYYWQKKLKSRNRLPGFIPVVINSAPAIPTQGFPDSLYSASAMSRPVEIEFPNKTIIRIRGELDLSVLKALIHLND
ncbi:MAG: IS66 family insertion sequence element accessory protein TnpB [Bacteroidota bacterium]